MSVFPSLPLPKQLLLFHSDIQLLIFFLSPLKLLLFES